MSDSDSSSQESRSELAELKAQMSEMMKMIQGLQKSRSLDENTSTPIVTQPPPKSAPKVNQNISTETGQHKETTLKWPTYGLPPNYNPLYEDSQGETNFVTTEHKKNTQNTYYAPSRFTQTQTHNPNTYPQNQNTNATTNTYIPPNSNIMQYPPQYNNNHHPRQNHFTQNLNEKKTPQFDPIPVTYAEIFEYLVAGGFIAPIIGRVPESPGPWFNPNVTCAYHSRVIGHSIEHCRAHKYRVQHLVDTKHLTFTAAPPDVHKNPLPNHGNQGINDVEVPEIKTPMKVIFQEMCKHRMVEKLMEDEDPNSCEWHGPIGHTLEDCSEFRLLLQKMLDMRLITVESGPSGQSVNAITQGEGDTSRTPRPSMTRFCPVMNVPHNALSHSSRWVPVMKPPSSMPYIEAAEEALETSFQGLEIANASFVRERISEQRPQPSGASLMMAKVMLNKGYQPGTGLGKFGQGIESILIPQGTKGRQSLGYEPTQKDWEKAAKEKRKGRMARLGQFEYKAGGILIPHICQSFISAGFASGTIAVVGGAGPGNQTNYVIQCPPGAVLNNWMEEDVSPRVFYENM
ncbi:hypothetical protein Lal_00021287 [Lupinus albus]|nr:hypothetical protein Lal_00021287 [Lupinus albus]